MDETLAMDPLIILADEPVGNLDGVTRADTMHLLFELGNDGRRVVTPIHDAPYVRHTVPMVDGGIAG